MDEWRVLAYRVESTLVSFVAGAKAAEFLWLVNAAIMKLDTQAYAMRRALMGATILELNAIPTPPPDGYRPIGLIERARIEFEALRWSHAMAGHIVSLYGARHGLLHGDPLWQTWEGHHATAIQRGQVALRALHNAAATCQATDDAQVMALSFPNSPDTCVAWASAAQGLMRRAVSEATAARDMVLLMRDAVILEYVAACNVLNG